MLPQVSALQFNRLDDINAVAPMSAADEACLAELKAVLTKHGRQSRFGIALLHKHFDLAADELLVEHCDVERRVLTTRPKKICDIGDTPLIQTIFAFDPELERDCQPYCPTDAKGRHQGRKDHL